jgi:hypothetical protein
VYRRGPRKTQPPNVKYVKEMVARSGRTPT